MLKNNKKYKESDDNFNKVIESVVPDEPEIKDPLPLIIQSSIN